MTDLRHYNRQFVTEFIQLYRSHPCLWKIKSNEYSDRAKKNKAYEKMVIKLKEVDPSATRDSVKRKIDSLRGCFRKELRKIAASKTTGEVYTPILWYFNQLTFLREQETPREAVTNIDEEINISQPTAKIEQGNINPGCYERKEPLKKNTMHMENLNKNKKSNEAERKKMSANYERNKLLEKAAMHMEKLSKHRERDEADIFAECWATSYRKLDDTQKLYAKRACDEIFILGQLGKLNFNTVRTETSSYKSSLANFHDVRNRQSTSTLIHSTLSQNNHEEGSQYSSFTDIPPKRNEYDDESSNSNSFEDSVGEESDELPNTSMKLEDSKIKTERFEVIEHLSEQPPNTSMELENSEIKIEKFEEQCQVPDVMFSEGVDRQTEFINGNNANELQRERPTAVLSSMQSDPPSPAPSDISSVTPQSSSLTTKRSYILVPPKSMRLDHTEHWVEWGAKGRCRVCRKGIPKSKCSKCNVHLCCNPQKNCFVLFHS